MVRYQSGQMDQTVNLTAHAFEGSNPSLTTSINKSFSALILLRALEKDSQKEVLGEKRIFSPIGVLNIYAKGRKVLKGNHWGFLLRSSALSFPVAAERRILPSLPSQAKK